MTTADYAKACARISEAHGDKVAVHVREASPGFVAQSYVLIPHPVTGLVTRHEIDHVWGEPILDRNGCKVEVPDLDERGVQRYEQEAVTRYDVVEEDGEPVAVSVPVVDEEQRQVFRDLLDKPLKKILRRQVTRSPDAVATKLAEDTAKTIERHAAELAEDLAKS